MKIATAKEGDLEQARHTAQQAGDILSAGGLVVFPTETVYGVGALANSDRGMSALRKFKDRPDSQPFTVHLPAPDQAQRYVDTSDPQLGRLLAKVFPGPVTVLVDVTEAVIKARLKDLGLGPKARGRIYHDRTVGLRCPAHPLGRQVLGAVTAPVLATSANRRGQPPPTDAQQAAQTVDDSIDLIVDGGPCRYAKSSTIVHVKGIGNRTHVEVVRAGVYDERLIRKLMSWTLLLVCSGNTCRSPMAEGLAKQILAEQRGIGVDDLEAAGLRVTSAGAYAAPGIPPTDHAVRALKKFGIDIAGHRSRRISPELINQADVIYCMTDSHVDQIITISPSMRDKTFRLDPDGNLEDPFGSGPTHYQRCAETIRRRLQQRLKELQP